MRPNLFHCLLAAIAFLFVSCDPSEMKQEETPKDTTYTIDFQIDAETLIGLDGATVTNDLRICEYNDKNERINIQDLRNIKYGSKHNLKANKQAVKVTMCLYISVSYKGNELDENAWVAQVYYLEPESHTTIMIDGYTALGSSDPLK